MEPKHEVISRVELESSKEEVLTYKKSPNGHSGKGVDCKSGETSHKGHGEKSVERKIRRRKRKRVKKVSIGNKEDDKENVEPKHKVTSREELESSKEEVLTCKSFEVVEKIFDERGHNGLDPGEDWRVMINER